MNKAEKQPKTVQGTAMAKTEVKPGPLVILKNAQPTEAELKAEIEKLKRQIDLVPQNLEDRILYYKQKQEWVNNLKKISAEREQLLNIQSEVFDDLEQNEFLTENFALSVVRQSKYGADGNIFKIQNPVLIGEILKIVLAKMNDKIEELQISIAN